MVEKCCKENGAKKLNFITAILYLMKYIKEYKLHFFRFYIGWLVDSIVSILLPLLYGVMLDEIVYRKDFDIFYKLAIIVALVSLFSIGMYFLIYAQHHYILTKFSFSIKNDIFRHFVKCRASYLLNIDAGKLVPYFHYYPSECVHFLIRGVVHQVNRILIICAVLIYLFKLDIRLGVVALVGAMLSLFSTIYMGKWTDKLSMQYRTKCEKLTGWMFEMLSSIRDIRLIGAAKQIEERFREKNLETFEVYNKNNYVKVTADGLNYIINWGVILIVYIFAGIMAYKESLSVGTFTIIIIYFTRLKDQVIQLNESHIDAKHRVVFIQKIYEFFQMETEKNWKGTKKFTGIDKEIRIQDVKFSYLNSEEVLSGVTFSIQKGEKVGIVGKSGCGKTTLVQLLIGLFESTGGNIFFDDKDIEEYSLYSLSTNIGIIEQEVLLFDGTIRYNLMMGNINATEEELRWACKQAGILEWIDTLADGLDAKIFANGNGLSGGQRQRLGIARLYLKDPQIIIFDEATSALDQQTEQEIFLAWEEVLKNKTAIIISHKLSTIKTCDRVIVLQNGRVHAEGTPVELGQDNEYFKKLYSIQ